MAGPTGSQGICRVCHNEPVTDEQQIRKALEVVIDPELRRSIVELDMVRSIEISANGVVDVTVSLTTPGLPDQGPLPDRRRARPSRRSRA